VIQLDESGNVVEPAVVREGSKIGFCFYDNTNYGSSELEYYLDCENGNPDALRVTMGLSRGWGDTYPWGLVGQYLDITGLPDGRYRLRVTADGNSADGSDQFLDSDETNNPTWGRPADNGRYCDGAGVRAQCPPVG
jgi:hypothetical protein